MVILGVDPGARATGYGLLEGEGSSWHHRASGVIRPPARAPLAARLAALDQALRELIAEHRPAEVAVETLFHSRSPRSAIVLGHARGVILVAASASGALVAEYAPLEIKMSVTGSGSASKQQVREMVHRLVDAPPKMSLDAADALAVALCHVHRRDSLAVGRRR
jgi:crossover junction endodeoxyribonuclease RuvC